MQACKIPGLLCFLPLSALALIVSWEHARAAVAPVALQQRALKSPWALLEEGKYLAALKLAEDQAERNPGDPMAATVLATMRAAVGDHAGAKEALEGTAQKAAKLGTPPDLGKRQDAVHAIVEEAKSRQVVILNEAHHVPETRILTLAVAKALYEEGFRYLACEAFSAEIEQYDEVGTATRETCGGYIMEPVFGDLIRQAGKIGYQFVRYETESRSTSGDSSDRINMRETEQCRHLIERIFAKDPDARVLIHCGYSHATENWRTLADGRQMGWMAARLGRELGTDPLTVDQTRQRSGASELDGTGVWRYAVAQGLVPRPTVFSQTDGGYFVEGEGWTGKVDMQVFHPATEREDGRPTWLRMDGYRKPVEIPVDLEPTVGRVLIQAFVEGESESAVPMDQVIWYADDLSPVLMLPTGRYRVVAQNEEGEAVGFSACTGE